MVGTGEDRRPDLCNNWMPVVDGFLQQFQRKAKLQRKWYSDTISFAVLHCTFLCLCPLLLSETVYCWPLVYTFPVCIVVSSRQHTWADRHSDMTTTQRVCSLYTAANAAGSLHQICLTFRNCYKMRTAELQLFIKIYNPQYLLQKHNLLAPASEASQHYKPEMDMGPFLSTQPNPTQPI